MKGQRAMATDEGRQAVSGISRRSALRGGLLAIAGVATVGAVSALLTNPAKAVTPDPQSGWAYCVFCHNMFWVAGMGHSACTGNDIDGTHAYGAGNYNYSINNNEPEWTSGTDPQAHWTWCNDCQSLFWGQTNSACAGNRDFLSGDPLPHAVGSGTNYEVYWGLTNIAHLQTGWRWCTTCHVLFYPKAGSANGGSCAWFDHNTGSYPEHQGGSTIYDVYTFSTV
jgi:hypothetical protein